MRLRSIPILLALAALVPAQFAQGQKANPTDASAMWSAIKTALLSENGDLFFESNLKYSLVPGGTKSVHALMGTVISSHPAEQPDEFVLALSDRIHPEVTLKLIDKQGIDHYKGPIAPGAKITFRGIAKAFKRDPFMLTIEVGAADGAGPTFAVIAEANEQATPAEMPSVWVNYPSRLGKGSIKINLDGLPLHTFTINDHGSTSETAGVRLERFLATAGWYPYPHSLDNQLHYSVEVEGLQSVVTLDLAGVGSFFDRQAWLVPNGKPDSKPEAALVFVQADGTLIQRVEDIQRIRVSEPR
jgi:hypothetical protein